MQIEFFDRLETREEELGAAVLSLMPAPLTAASSQHVATIYGAVHAASAIPVCNRLTGSNELEQPEEVSSVPSSRGFKALLAAFQATGGAARGDELAGLMADRQLGTLASLARSIVSGDVLSFEWRHSFWVPMFQFEPDDLSLKKGSRKVLAELVKVFEPWAIAAWFAQPNSWLKCQRPVDLLDSNLSAVFAAARADRFVANS